MMWEYLIDLSSGIRECRVVLLPCPQFEGVCGMSQSPTSPKGGVDIDIQGYERMHDNII